jgi:tetratricopeptide (TPR) repeat protein
VRAQRDRLCASRSFRGAKLRKLLTLLVEEWLTDGGKKLSERYIGEAMGEPLTFEEHSSKWGYPKTRGNLGHVRSRVKKFHETDGYRDQVIIKLNPGSYVPVIMRNPVSTSVPDLEPEVARLVLRAKTALDARTLRGAWRALQYYQQMPLSTGNPRHTANMVFIPMAAGPVIPGAVAAMRPMIDPAREQMRASGVEPWEWIFADACAIACFEHRWQEALDALTVAVKNSQGEASYFWWHTALLASRGRAAEAIHILDGGVRHFLRTSLAARTDLALLQIMAGQFADAEEMLAGCSDFAAPNNPAVAFHQAMLMEAQDRLEEAAAPIMALFSAQDNTVLSSEQVGAALERKDWHTFLSGMLALIFGRAGATDVAAKFLDILLECKGRMPASSSVEIALALIGLGRFDEATEWLSRAALEEADPLAMWFHVFPPLRHLRKQSKFRELLGRLRLPVS